MLCLLLLLSLTHSLFGASIPTGRNSPSYQDPRHDIHARETPILGNDRTIWDIVWACLATIFACAWVAVHPNIPSPKADWKARFKIRLMVMAYAWIAPECVTMWAMRQLLSARKLVSLYNEQRGIPEDTRTYFALLWDSLSPFRDGSEDIAARRWTLTHGFFAQMGGYMIHREEEPYWTLFLESVDLERDMDLVPYYTEAEIMDRSKGDVLSKGIALLQTLWFVTQYATRAASRLPLTELETVTLAFSALNIATCILWWHKPLNVQCPIRVSETPSSRVSSVRAGAHSRPRDDHTIPYTSSLSDLDEQASVPANTWEETVYLVDVEWEGLCDIPWFPGFPQFDAETLMKDNPGSGSQTLVATPASATKDIEKVDEDAWLELDKEDTRNIPRESDWDVLFELPWFPSVEVPPIPQPSTTSADHTRQRVTPRDLPGRIRWRYRMSRTWRVLPQYIILTIDGGWYTIHLYYDGVERNDDLSLLDFRNDKSVWVDFYVPLFLRSLPWMGQMCLLIPLWSPYVVSVSFYSLTVYPLFVFLLSPLAGMTGMSPNTDQPWLDSRYPLQVPAFFAGSPNFLDQYLRVKIWYTIFCLTAIFGAIHAFSWSAHFPSATEQTLWRISTFCICGVPPTVALWVLYRRSRFPQFGMNAASLGMNTSFSLARVKDLWQLTKFVAARFGKLGMPIYIFGRMVLITIAFTSLRNLPPETFKIVGWTSAIPHL